MRQLKVASDGMLLLAVVFLVVALVGPAWVYGLAALCLVAAVVLTVLRRRTQAARRSARSQT